MEVKRLLFFIILILFVAVFLLIYVVFFGLLKNRIQIEKRIIELKDIDDKKQDNNDMHLLETLRVLLFSVYRYSLLKLTPVRTLEKFTNKLERAGLLKKRTKEQWLYLKSMFTFVMSALIGLLSYIVSKDALKTFALMAITMLYMNFFFNFYLSRKVETRKKQILKDLPFTLDLITVSVEAGLSFDGAMAKVVSNISGELCDEFAKSLKEIRMGIERKIALKNMGDRCDVKELTMFVTSIIQSDELGVGLGKILRIEAAEMRERRKQAAREKAMKAPVKMLFPLIFFIFPTIFIIILGPAVIQIMGFFGS